MTRLCRLRDGAGRPGCQVCAPAAEVAGMHLPCLQPNQLPQDHRGGRAHRFMESADIGCAFRETFIALRANVRRGLHTSGQLYALEMDSCIPGELLDTLWLPAAAHGLPPGLAGDDPADLAAAAFGAPAPEQPLHAGARHALLRQLLAQPHPPMLLVWAGERIAADGHPVLRVEVASADGLYAAEHLVCPGRGWRRLDLLRDRKSVV